MKKISTILLISGFTLFFLSCEKDVDDTPNQTRDTIQLKTPG
jgi:hypothetical protein